MRRDETAILPVSGVSIREGRFRLSFWMPAEGVKMNESYAEWLVKQKEPAYAWPVRIGMGFLCAVAFLAAVLTGIIGMIALVAVGAATYFVFRGLKVEYEYLYVTNQFSIDKIMNQMKRKKAMECSMDEIQMIAPVKSDTLKNYERSDMKVVDYSSKEPNARLFAMIYQNGGVTTKVIFEPSDKMLQCFRMTAPRKVSLQ
ncbi:MAG: DUF6106 family protein [bacterium]|nr:DUF6106 family protein [bacterium]